MPERLVTSPDTCKVEWSGVQTAMTNALARWVRATTGRAHLDLGERTAPFVRNGAPGGVIVTACRTHLDGSAAEVVPDGFSPKCSNCVTIARRRTTTA
jgi:hypothetical protein